MKKLLTNRKLIPIVGGVLLVLFVLYIFVAPASWPKPFNVRFETASAAAAEQGGTPTTEVVSESATVEAAATGEADLPAVEGRPAGAGQVLAMEPRWGVMYPLDSKVVNLAEPGGLRYLQATVVLEMLPLVEDYYELSAEERTEADEEFQLKVSDLRPIIDDIVTGVLSSKSYNDIATIEGKEALKEELKAKINASLGYQGVMNVYFTDFVIQ